MEVGRVQYRVIVAFHTLFIAACIAVTMFRNPSVSPVLSLTGLVGEAAAQRLRYWSIVTLGEAWNTRITVGEQMPVRTSRPYQHIRDPNYGAVVIEIACIPLIRGLVIIATSFSLANAILLAFRIPLEELALGEPYQRAFATRRRFIHSRLRSLRPEIFG